MTAQIVRTVQKATCGDLKNFKRSGVVCEPLPVKRTAKKYKVFPASSISCWPLSGAKKLFRPAEQVFRTL